MADRLQNHVRTRRERAGLSQQQLAATVGVTRQTLGAIEASRHVPSTQLALLLARALGCRVDDLFALPPRHGLAARLAPGGSPSSTRVMLGRVSGNWIAHRVAADATSAANGLLMETGGQASDAYTPVLPLDDPTQLEANLLVAGCAPLLGLLAQRVGSRFRDASMSWLPRSSGHAIDLLADGLVHVAGLHLSGGRARDGNRSAVKTRFRGRRMLIVNLTRWREGLLVAPGNPLGVEAPADLLRDDVRFARRDPGAGASRLLSRMLSSEQRSDPALCTGPLASGHHEVAQMIRFGVADVGVAIESVAIAAGLPFIPLAEERFDLVIPGELADSPFVGRMLQTLEERAFRHEAQSLPGYDTSSAGEVSTVG
ncbi:MAG: helix-turn-helix domain-containing protein [Myxococcales bacterium]|nr:helix-turn-helix domain-containing protein [Myxococcales bacterium]